MEKTSHFWAGWEMDNQGLEFSGFSGSLPAGQLKSGLSLAVSTEHSELSLQDAPPGIN